MSEWQIIMWYDSIENSRHSQTETMKVSLTVNKKQQKKPPGIKELKKDDPWGEEVQYRQACTGQMSKESLISKPKSWQKIKPK